MSPPRTVRRRFPDYGWAWPGGDLDLLLKAVLLADDDAALAAAFRWLESNRIEDTTFRDQRLLAALSERFGRRLGPSPAYPRLVGLQRMLWSKSRLIFRESREALAALADAGIPFMLIKGASRVALDSSAQRSRVSHDIDVLVRPPDMGAAFAALLALGWQASSGAGALRLTSQAATFRAMNFFKGQYGDVDLHQAAYHPVHANARDEHGLWQRSLPVSLEGIMARAPGAADRIALAIGHGGLDAHAHSDWLVDVDNAVRSGSVDWDSLVGTLAARRLLVPAASALTYLAQEIGSPVPQDVIETILKRADGEGLLRRAVLLECKPRTDFNLFSATARGMAKQLRLLGGKLSAAPVRQPLWTTHRARRVGKGAAEPAQSAVSVPVGARRRGIAEIVVRVNLPGVSRRVELELSTKSRHVALLRYRNILFHSGLRDLTFRGPIDLDECEESLFIEARASRFTRQWENREESDRYSALPFSITRVSIR